MTPSIVFNVFLSSGGNLAGIEVRVLFISTHAMHMLPDYSDDEIEVYVSEGEDAESSD